MPGPELSRADREKALKALIRETISNAGEVAPDVLPHRVKARLKDQTFSDIDLDALIRETIAEQRRRR